MGRQLCVGALVIGAVVLSIRTSGAQPAPSVEQTIVQMEKDLLQANIKKDAAALDRMVADDFVVIDFTGRTITKAEALKDLKDGASVTQSAEFGPLKVRVYGDTAIVNGSDTEKSTYKGKDSTGTYVWTDVFVKRNGRWQLVTSQNVKTK